MQIHSLPAGGALTAIKHRFIGCLCKQSSAVVMNTTLTLWGLRVFWGPGEVLTCPDISAFFSC